MFRLSEEETERVMRSEAAAACAGNPSRISGDCYADGAEPIGSRPSNWSQVVTRSKKHRGLAYRPYAFTEQGVDMFSSVLRSLRAFRVIIAIRRSFVQLRQLLVSHADLAKKWADLEGCYDRQFKAMFDAIRELMEPPMASQKRQMGFHTGPSRSLQKSDADAPSKIS
jgi:hypothetical protein